MFPVLVATGVVGIFGAGANSSATEDNSNAIDVASSPVAEESAPELEYIDPPEFEDDEVEEGTIPF